MARARRPYNRLIPGQRQLSAQDLNRVIEDVSPPPVAGPRQRPGQGTGILAAARARRFQIVAVRGDYLECYPYDGASADTAAKFTVAKPPRLRASETDYNGVSFSAYGSDGQTRTASDTVTTESQRVTPDYLVGAEIYAIQSPVGGTGVSDAPAWIDLNLDARTWAEVQT